MPLQQLPPPSKRKTHEWNRISYWKSITLFFILVWLVPFPKGISAWCGSIDRSPILCARVRAKIFFLEFVLIRTETHVMAALSLSTSNLLPITNGAIHNSQEKYCCIVSSHSEKSWWKFLGKTVAQQRQSPQFPLFPCTHLAHPPHTCEGYWDFQRLHRLLLKAILSVLHFVTNEVIQIHMKQEQYKKPLPFFKK